MLYAVRGDGAVYKSMTVAEPGVVVAARFAFGSCLRQSPVVTVLSERFVRRRERLLGPNGATSKAIELLTGCYMLVQRYMGSFKELKAVPRIVEDCLKNVHPVFHIKALMIKRELAKDPELAAQNWDRFLPKFKKRNVKQKKTKVKEKKPYTPFPPPQQPSKMDLQLESGEYFLSADKKAFRKWDAKKEKQAEKVAEKKQKRESSFLPPVEPKMNRREGEMREGKMDSKTDIAAIADSLKKKVTTMVSDTGGKHASGVEDYVAFGEEHKRKKPVRVPGENDAREFKGKKRIV